MSIFAKNKDLVFYSMNSIPHSNKRRITEGLLGVGIERATLRNILSADPPGVEGVVQIRRPLVGQDKRVDTKPRTARERAEMNKLVTSGRGTD